MSRLGWDEPRRFTRPDRTSGPAGLNRPGKVRVRNRVIREVDDLVRRTSPPLLRATSSRAADMRTTYGPDAPAPTQDLRTNPRLTPPPPAANSSTVVDVLRISQAVDDKRLDRIGGTVDEEG